MATRTLCERFMKAAVKTVRPTLWSGWAAAANGQPLSHCRSRQFSQACSLGFRESVSDWPLQSPQQSRGASPTHAAASDYPSPNEIHRLFSNMAKGNYEALFDRVSADVEWTVMGTHPCAGRYRTLKDFQAGTLARLGKIMKQPGLNLAVRNVIGGGDQEWCTVELVANAECLNGFQFDNCYAWCCRFDKGGKIVEVRAYLDSWMVRQAIIENETPSHRAEVPKVERPR